MSSLLVVGCQYECWKSGEPGDPGNPLPLAQTCRMVGVPKATDAKVCEAFVSASVSICETRGESGSQRRDYWNRGSAARLMHMGNPHSPALLARASRRYRGFGERQMG